MFTCNLKMEQKGEQTYILTAPLTYHDGVYYIIVREGFDFDGASVPQALWSFGLSPMSGGYQRSACMHDALYASKVLPRDVADKLFLEAMESEGVSYFKRLAMYRAVRMFGFLSWNKSNETETYIKFISIKKGL